MIHHGKVLYNRGYGMADQEYWMMLAKTGELFVEATGEDTLVFAL